ncbi:hypothetical protein CK203_076234 [Vitis vinifera]|uniref:Uncharacterized protein n=1 Tax=Vitis vinifera TaxID=29760 RepID=A0A438EE40_VITVI|nr:hypothetical protein CK203_076234 [Vitis vinifera]
MTIEIIDVEDAGIWRGNIEKIFIDIMVNEVNKGDMDSSTFSTNTWRRILLEDVETNTVHALEETWQNYIRAHPNAKRFRSKGCLNYNLLGLIFNPSTTIGALHYSSTQDPLNTDEKTKAMLS